MLIRNRNEKVLGFVVSAASCCLFCTAILGRGTKIDHAGDGRHVNRSAFWQRNGKTALSGFRNMYHATVLQVDDPVYPFRMWFFVGRALTFRSNNRWNSPRKGSTNNSYTRVLTG